MCFMSPQTNSTIVFSVRWISQVLNIEVPMALALYAWSSVSKIIVEITYAVHVFYLQTTLEYFE